tara:strand:+ start:5198 stop:5512 length:315 start_codon:yes stop_codon:yes gene_type:complete
LNNNNTIFTNLELRDSIDYLMEVDDIESDITDLTNTVDSLSDIVDDDTGRVGYIRQLTAEFLEYLMTLNDEISSQIDIPKSEELMSKMIGRTARKRYYMSKFRL